MLHSCFYSFVFFFKQKTAYEMRISDWSSDVCSSDLYAVLAQPFDIASGSGMFPHADIHGGQSKDRLVRGEQERCGKAVGNAGRHLGEKIGRGGTNDQEIGRASCRGRGW